MGKIRILLADDHSLLRQGLRKILEARPEWQIVAEAGNGREAVERTLETRPDVVVLDIAMPQLNGIEAARQISTKAPEISILVLSTYSDEPFVLQALRAGARGYLLKDCADSDLLGAITAVSQGKSFFSPAVARVMLDDYVRQMTQRGITDRYECLSTREREVLQLIAEGRTNKEIANTLCVSQNTVETHRAHIMEKLALRNTADIVLYAVRRGIIS